MLVLLIVLGGGLGERFVMVHWRMPSQSVLRYLVRKEHSEVVSVVVVVVVVILSTKASSSILNE
jgi:uncharacterized protein (UPF0548 family)